MTRRVKHIEFTFICDQTIHTTEELERVRGMFIQCSKTIDQVLQDLAEFRSYLDNENSEDAARTGGADH
jgi:hypothetical protein